MTALTYGLMYAIAGGETTGMRCAQLKFTTFDGFKPDGRQRMWRFLGSCLSVVTVLGLVWTFGMRKAWAGRTTSRAPSPRRAKSTP